MSKSIIVLYHAECPDGFAAAWVAHKKFGDLAEYLPVFHNNTAILDNFAGTQVYLLDITYDMATMKQLIARNEVTVLDHHQMRKKEVESAQRHAFSLDKSGAGLAWEHFFSGQSLPYLLGLIQEEDLWKFKSENVKEILAAVSIYPGAYTDFAVFDKLVNDLEVPAIRNTFAAEGKIVVRHRDKLIADMVKRANPIIFDGMDILAINASMLVSEIGNTVASAHQPPVALIWSVRRGRIAISLRSDGTIDVAKIAQKYGGGGHKAAAAFTLPLDSPLPWRYRKDN